MPDACVNDIIVCFAPIRTDFYRWSDDLRSLHGSPRATLLTCLLYISTCNRPLRRLSVLRARWIVLRATWFGNRWTRMKDDITTADSTWPTDVRTYVRAFLSRLTRRCPHYICSLSDVDLMCAVFTRSLYLFKLQYKPASVSVINYLERDVLFTLWLQLWGLVSFGDTNPPLGLP